MKKLFFCLISIYCFLINCQFVRAEAFETNYDVYYYVQSNGKIKVTQDITITNRLSNIYASSYSLTLSDLQLENIKAEDSHGLLKTQISQSDNKKTINISFIEPTVGVDKKQSFRISYDILNLAKKNGQIWEIDIPKLAKDSQIDSYHLTLEVPDSLGIPSGIKPIPLETKKLSDSSLYIFSQDQLAKSGVSASFGQFQIFNFTIKYQIENRETSTNDYSIALPPDTLYQKIYYQLLNPEPDNVRVDEDGNWLAIYRLKANELLDIEARGNVRIYSKAQKEKFFQLSNPEKYLKADKYWESDNQDIQQIAHVLKTPHQIYDYVLKTLSYDYNRIGQGAERLGALKALANPATSLCMEFSDLFIALARAAGIPAREINGYASTQNSKIQQTESKADILHSWPEYYDSVREAWIPIDPTWGDTTEGIDYFTQMDVSHFAFVIHGQNSVLPYPAGSYKNDAKIEKGIQITYGSYVKEPDPEVKIISLMPTKIIFYQKYLGKIRIKNDSGSALYNTKVILSPQGISLNPTQDIIPVLPPKGVKEIDIAFKLTPLFSLNPRKLIVSVLSQTQTYPLEIYSFAGEIIPLILIIATVIILALFLTKTKFFVKNKQ